MDRSRAFRGYIASRPVAGERTAQHVQNLVVRDYARRKGLDFLLSATEWAMPNCFMILDQVLGEELPEIGGIIAFSLFMLPTDMVRRKAVWRRVLDLGKAIHFAHEGLAVASAADVARMEDIMLVRGIVSESWRP